MPAWKQIPRFLSAETSIPAVQDPQIPNASLRRILIIDDDVFTLDLVRAVLKNRFNILTAQSADQGLEIIRSGGIDLILLDLMLPGTDGMTLIRHLRSDAGSNAIPIVIVSAKADAGTIGAALTLAPPMLSPNHSIPLSSWRR